MEVIILICAYLLGSIPFGILLTRFAGLGNLREIGSGNIGATNVLRTGNKKVALAVLLLDMLKGLFAVIIAGLADTSIPLYGHPGWLTFAAGVLAVLGHVFPVWLKFKGGKGVATTFGVLLALYLGAGLTFAVFWIAVFALTRYSSLSALIAMSAVMVLVWFNLGGYSLSAWPEAPVAFTLLTVIMFVTHRANIQRLKDGTELRFGKTDA